MACTSNLTIRAGITLYSPWSTQCYENITHWYYCNPGINILYFNMLLDRLGLKAEYTVYDRDQDTLHALRAGEIDLVASTVALAGHGREGLIVSPATSCDNVGFVTPLLQGNLQNRLWLFEPLSPIVWVCFWQIVICCLVITRNAGNYGVRHLMEVYFRSVLRQEHGFEPGGNVDRIAYISFSFLVLLTYTFYSSVLIQHLIYQPELTARSLDRLVNLAENGKIGFLQAAPMSYYKSILEFEDFENLEKIPESGITQMGDRYTTQDIYRKVLEEGDLFYIGSYNSKYPYFPAYAKHLRLIEGPPIPGKSYHVFYRQGFPCVEEFNFAILMGFYKDSFSVALHNYTAWKYRRDTGKFLPKTIGTTATTLKNRKITMNDLFFVNGVFCVLVAFSFSVLLFELFSSTWVALSNEGI